MTLEDLKTFQIVCRCESMSEAARQLGCSQPAISQHIARLEKEFQISLLERGKKGIALTEPGQLLLEHIEEAFESLNSAQDLLRSWHSGVSGELRISTGGITVKHLMKASVQQFQKDYPQASLSFQSATRTDSCLAALKHQSIDLAFVSLRQERLGVETRPVARLQWSLGVLEQDPFFQGKTEISLRHLDGKAMIGLPQSTNSFQYLERSFQKQGLTLDFKTQVDDWEMALFFVELGLGYAVLPHIFGSKNAAVRCLPISDMEPLTVGWIARKFKFLNEAAKIFMRLVEEEIQRLSHEVSGIELLKTSTFF
jgi:DNA-binding transcriptional LysR family regulator